MDGLCTDFNELLHFIFCVKKPKNNKKFIMPKKKGILDDYCIIETYMYDKNAIEKKNN